MARVAAQQLAPAPLTIELAIRLSDGSFETKVIVPIDCDDKTRSKSIDRWLKLAGEAMALGVENLSASFPIDSGKDA